MARRETIQLALFLGKNTTVPKERTSIPFPKVHYRVSPQPFGISSYSNTNASRTRTGIKILKKVKKSNEIL